MRKAFLVLVALTFVLTTAAPSSASQAQDYLGYGTLNINAKGPEGSTITPGQRIIRLRMYKPGNHLACYDQGTVVIDSESSVFKPDPLTDKTENDSYDVWINVTVGGSRGSTYDVTATCRNWLFTGKVTIRSGTQPPELPNNGIPVLPTATLGLTLVLLGGLLLLGDRRRSAAGSGHPPDSASQVRR
jgi:hypothetical protein